MQHRFKRNYIEKNIKIIRNVGSVYRCEYCQKGFSLRSMLHVHILAKHTAVKPFICEECGKGFVTRPGLNIHLKKHKTDEKLEYPCGECGKV
jgi:KRAB domain-containing zinc finger protein